MKNTSLSLADLGQIRVLALRHVLAGGGVVPGDELADADIIPRLASRHFNGAAKESWLRHHVQTCKLDYDASEKLWTAIWDLVGAHADAGFTLGAAVGLVINHPGLAADVVTPAGKRGGLRSKSQAKNQ